METIWDSVQGDEYVECVVSLPAVPVPIVFGTTASPSGTAASAPPPAPLFPEAMAVEPERVGGLLSGDWAALFRVSQGILAPVLPWLLQVLCCNPEMSWWEIKWLKSVILAFPCQVGPDRNILIQRAQHTLGPITAPLIDSLITTIESQCGLEARRLLGLQEHNNAQEQEDGLREPSAAQEEEQEQEQEDSPAAPSGPTTSPPSGSSTADTEDLPGTSSEALGGDAGNLPTTVSPGEWPSEKPGPKAASPVEQGCSPGPSACSQGGKRSASGPWHPRKRRACSAQRASPPCKRQLPPLL
ncbi:hypothetical protein ASZ78_004194 [Callipepla squamata]|uniref:Uncharacterized protein n=1 Tax=Callipepla squamata TaxID=9009 RepID=A0A226MD90_CALSU|nr:hypothetical protein ASZ78_004194 [Callipepla squamata]